jgi:hypothetical protein
MTTRIRVSGTHKVLGLSQPAADALAERLYAKAVEYAQRFPEVRDAASFLGGDSRDSG